MPGTPACDHLPPFLFLLSRRFLYKTDRSFIMKIAIFWMLLLCEVDTVASQNSIVTTFTPVMNCGGVGSDGVPLYILQSGTSYQTGQVVFFNLKVSWTEWLFNPSGCIHLCNITPTPQVTPGMPFITSSVQLSWVNYSPANWVPLGQFAGGDCMAMVLSGSGAPPEGFIEADDNKDAIPGPEAYSIAVSGTYIAA